MPVRCRGRAARPRGHPAIRFGNREPGADNHPESGPGHDSDSEGNHAPIGPARRRNPWFRRAPRHRPEASTMTSRERRPISPPVGPEGAGPSRPSWRRTWFSKRTQWQVGQSHRSGCRVNGRCETKPIGVWEVPQGSPIIARPEPNEPNGLCTNTLPPETVYEYKETLGYLGTQHCVTHTACISHDPISCLRGEGICAKPSQWQLGVSGCDRTQPDPSNRSQFPARRNSERSQW